MFSDCVHILQFLTLSELKLQIFVLMSFHNIPLRIIFLIDWFKFWPFQIGVKRSLKKEWQDFAATTNIATYSQKKPRGRFSENPAYRTPWISRRVRRRALVKKIPKLTKTDRNRQKRTKTHRNGHKQTETDWHGLKLTETDQDGQKQKYTDRSGLNQTKMEKNWLK